MEEWESDIERKEGREMGVGERPSNQERISPTPPLGWSKLDSLSKSPLRCGCRWKWE